MRIELSRGLWRPVTENDLAAVVAIADVVHVNYPEDAAAIADRLRLYPAGCAMLEMDGKPVGYTLTHPWRYGEPPTLNMMLNAIPDRPTTYYVHDLALLPETRGTGAGAAMAGAIVAHARETGHDNASLVAVNSSVPFWSRFGFEVVHEPALAAKLATYDADARFMVCKLTGN